MSACLQDLLIHFIDEKNVAHSWIYLHSSIFSNTITKCGIWILTKKSHLFSLQSWRLKVQDCNDYFETGSGSPGWPRTFSVAKITLKFLFLLLPSLECKHHRCLLPHQFLCANEELSLERPEFQASIYHWATCLSPKSSILRGFSSQVNLCWGSVFQGTSWWMALWQELMCEREGLCGKIGSQRVGGPNLLFL